MMQLTHVNCLTFLSTFSVIKQKRFKQAAGGNFYTLDFFTLNFTGNVCILFNLQTLNSLDLTFSPIVK